MDAALQQQDSISIGRLAHRIKSPAKTVGAMQFFTLCQTLEQLNDDSTIEQTTELIDQLQQLFTKIQEHVNVMFSP